MKRKHLRNALIAAAIVPFTARAASAATDYYWFQPAGGSGSWDTFNQNWSSTQGVVPDHIWNNSGTERGNFINTFGEYAVTVTNGQTVTSATDRHYSHGVALTVGIGF